MLRLGRRTLVTRHGDVVDVLGRDEDFTVAEVNGRRMYRWSGPFILGMDRGEAYDREAGALRRAVPTDDLDRIRGLVATEATQLIDQARVEGRIDVVGQYARVVATRVVARYFGAPGPDEESTMRWMRALFDAVFLDDSPRAQQAATLTVADQGPYMRSLIAQRRAAVDAGEPLPDDVLSRLVSLGAEERWLDDGAVQRNLNGLIVGAVDTTSKSVAHAVHELLRRPDALAGARRAALAGDVDAVRGYAWEALRFRPQTAFMVRHCAQGASIGRRAAKPASSVLVSPLSAMFDGAAFPHPRRFVADRPQDSYLHFGHGMHQCLGRHINGVQVPELVAALVRLPGLRRAPGSSGRLVYDGPFPDRLIVEFDGAGR